MTPGATARSNGGGRRVLITGAGEGIGRATALRLARGGARLALLGRRAALLEETAALCRSGAADVLVVPADITREDEVGAALARVGADWNGLDGLVNNAGAAFYGGVGETTLADWERVLQVNLTGPFLVTRAALDWLRRGAGPAIVMVASTLGVRGLAGASAYCAAKGGLVNFTRALAVELAGDGIRVNAICPGVVDTPMLGVDRGDGASAAQRRSELGQVHALGRIAQPAEIAVAIEHALSPDASFMTGAVIVVDGGQTCGFRR